MTENDKCKAYIMDGKIRKAHKILVGEPKARDPLRYTSIGKTINLHKCSRNRMWTGFMCPSGGLI
jgi:hypothetical protein